MLICALQSVSHLRNNSVCPPLDLKCQVRIEDHCEKNTHS